MEKWNKWHIFDKIIAMCDEHFEESCFKKFANLGRGLMDSED